MENVKGRRVTFKLKGRIQPFYEYPNDDTPGYSDGYGKLTDGSLETVAWEDFEELELWDLFEAYIEPVEIELRHLGAQVIDDEEEADNDI